MAHRDSQYICASCGEWVHIDNRTGHDLRDAYTVEWKKQADAKAIALWDACSWLVKAWEHTPDDQARVIVGIASERARDALEL